MTETPERVWMMPDFAAGLADQPQYIHTAEYVRADLLDDAVKGLEKITATRYGLQNIIEDYGHDTNAYNYHAMEYWKGIANAHQSNARATLAKLRSKT